MTVQSGAPGPCRYCRAGLICARAELAASLYPGVVGAHLLLGTIAGTGGGLVCDAIKHALGQLARPAELSVPSWALRSGFLGATVYLSAVHYLPPELQLEPVEVDLARPDSIDYHLPALKMAQLVTLPTLLS